MSVEEDTELRDLVAQTLEANGVLNKIRAELRANVFLALEEQESLQKKNISNKALKSFLETKEGHQVFSLVREFLQFFNLDFTLAVFDPESDYTNKASPREDLTSELNLYGIPNNTPLLSELLRRQNSSPTSPISPKLSSKIPQRVQNKSDDGHKLKNSSNSIIKKSTIAMSDDLDNEDELLKELGVSPISYPTNSSKNKNKSQPSWLESSNKSSTKNPGELSPLTGLGSLKDAPPLPGVGNKKVESPLDVTSPEWDDLMKIDQKISDLGFEVQEDDSGATRHKDKRSISLKQSDYNYEDDFIGSSSQKSDGLSITEEIEDEISIGSFAESNKDDDLLTTDHTVSQISGTGYDYTEDADMF